MLIFSNKSSIHVVRLRDVISECRLNRSKWGQKMEKEVDFVNIE